MPPKKGKAAPKGKAKKEPQAEAAPATDGAVEPVQEKAEAPVEDTPPAEETKEEQPQAEEPKAEESAAQDAPAKEEPAAEAQAEEGQPDTKSKKRKAEETQAGAGAQDGEAAQPKTEEKKAVKKRKSDAPAPREGARKSGRGAQKAQPTTEQLLNYLLSEAAADLCRPDDEAQELQERGSDFKTYSSTPLSPFEELLCAVVLSRPISHKLGMRSIRTLLNEPYAFTTPKAIISAGKEKRHQALIDAKTQHKEKTAEQIGLIADVVVQKFAKDDSDTSLDKLRNQASKGWDMERDLLQENIKGVGRTGLDIFFRRVQWLWPEAFPFVDERSSRGIEKLNLPKNPDELAKTLDRYWAKLDTSAIDKADKETMKRRAFVIICERATSADLEGNSEAILEAAASS